MTANPVHIETQLNNHPPKGSELPIDPIYNPEDISKIRKLLKNNSRDACMFDVALNTGLRTSDLLRLTVGRVRYLKVGDPFILKQQKTGKKVIIAWNKTAHKAVKRYLKTIPNADDKDFLFKSRKTSKPITVVRLNHLVKAWCKAIGLKGSFGSHTLRKTYGRQHHATGTPIAIISELLGHSSIEQTRTYLCLTNDDTMKASLKEI